MESQQRHRDSPSVTRLHLPLLHHDGHAGGDGHGGREHNRNKTAAIVLTCSILLNMVFLILYAQMPSDYSIGPRMKGQRRVCMDWSRKAAMEAEAAASFNCSGHGVVFVDTLSSDGNCECNHCFEGPQCATPVADCLVDVAGGDPLMFEAFWKENAQVSAVVLPGWYRMSYKPRESARPRSFLLDGLEHQIRALHALVGNAVTEGRHVVLGPGSIHLVNAAINSISRLTGQGPGPGTPLKVVAPAPYYHLYASQTQMLSTTAFVWAGDARQYARLQDGQDGNFVELLASPNNPDGQIQERVLAGSATTAVYDLAYYWPHFTPITSAADHDVMLFTLSSLSGHAGTRIGWAIVKDQALAEAMETYVWTSSLGVSHDSQLRATKILDAIVTGYAKKAAVTEETETRPSLIHRFVTSRHIFHYAHALLRFRWERLQDILFDSPRFSLQTLQPANCSFFAEPSLPSPAYAWIECTRDSEPDCEAVLREGGIVGTSGRMFDADPRFVRLSLVNREEMFHSLLTRLAHLVNASSRRRRRRR